MASNVVSLKNGINQTQGDQWAGMTVEDLRNDPVVEQVLHLTGDESVEVSVNGGGYESVDSDYVVEVGDVVRFGRSAGEKGSL